MITLEKPIAQEQKNISSSPLFEELSDESAASCSGGNIRQLLFAVGGGQFLVERYVSTSWSHQQVFNYAAHVCRYLREQFQTHVDWLG
jgi:hypothetical protein